MTDEELSAALQRLGIGTPSDVADNTGGKKKAPARYPADAPGWSKPQGDDVRDHAAQRGLQHATPAQVDDRASLPLGSLKYGPVNQSPASSTYMPATDPNAVQAEHYLNNLHRPNPPISSAPEGQWPHPSQLYPYTPGAHLNPSQEAGTKDATTLDRALDVQGRARKDLIPADHEWNQGIAPMSEEARNLFKQAHQEDAARQHQQLLDTRLKPKPDPGDRPPYVPNGPGAPNSLEKINRAGLPLSNMGPDARKKYGIGQEGAAETPASKAAAELILNGTLRGIPVDNLGKDGLRHALPQKSSKGETSMVVPTQTQQIQQPGNHKGDFIGTLAKLGIGAGMAASGGGPQALLAALGGGGGQQQPQVQPTEVNLTPPPTKPATSPTSTPAAPPGTAQPAKPATSQGGAQQQYSQDFPEGGGQQYSQDFPEGGGQQPASSGSSSMNPGEALGHITFGALLANPSLLGQLIPQQGFGSGQMMGG